MKIALQIGHILNIMFGISFAKNNTYTPLINQQVTKCVTHQMFRKFPEFKTGSEGKQ